jgi:DNA polymerase-3 subunit gamma/tau
MEIYMTKCEIKYEPKHINDVVFNNAFYEQQLKLIFQGYRTRHLFLCGTNGNGKTTIANLIAEELTRHCPFLLLNEEIEKILSQKDIYDYLMRVRQTASFSGASADDRVVIVFNELDKYEYSLDKLWTVMDRMKDDLLVIITTNYPMKFENAVRSRCEKFNFTRITPAEFLAKAQQILRQENLILSDSHVLHYLNSMTVKTSDVRDYLSVLDQLIFMMQKSLPLPQVPSSSEQLTQRQPTLTIAK